MRLRRRKNTGSMSAPGGAASQREQRRPRPTCRAGKGLSHAHVHKLMRVLRRGGLVKSVRGTEGRTSFARPPRADPRGAVLAALGDSFIDRVLRPHRAVERGLRANDDCSITIALDGLAGAVATRLPSTTQRSPPQRAGGWTVRDEVQTRDFPLRTSS